MKKLIAIVGPGINQKGGVSSVTETIYFSKIRDHFNIEIINTYGKNRLFELVKGLFKYICILKKVNIVHINMASRGSFFRKFLFIALTPKEKKIIIHSHGGLFIEFYNSQPRFIKGMIKYSFKKADLIIAVSNFYMKALNEEICNDDKKFRTIYNGIDLSDNINKNYSDNREINILFMGKMIEIRGIDDFIEVARRMKHLPKLKFIITGNGDKDLIVKKIEKYKLNNIDVIGWISGENKKKILEKTDILINPWIYESFGISMIEAMNYGATIIGYNKGSIPEVVEDKINGYIFEKGDIDGIVNIIKILISDKEKLAEISKNNIEKSKQFSKDIFIQNFLAIYNSL